MTTPPESTHDRLNRELARLKYRNLSYWGGWALLIGLFGLFGFLHINTPGDITYVTGVAGASQPAMSESGAYVITRVTVDGLQRDIRLPSRLVHPAVGEVICLRKGVRRFTGHTSYGIASKTSCNNTSPTHDVE